MDTVLFLILFLVLFATCYGFNFVDQKYKLKLADFLGSNSESLNDYGFETAKMRSKTESDEEIQLLRERVATLEKIVTDNAYELNEQLRKLK